jgi:hypothetical protein
VSPKDRLLDFVLERAESLPSEQQAQLLRAAAVVLAPPVWAKAILAQADDIEKTASQTNQLRLAFLEAIEPNQRRTR